MFSFSAVSIISSFVFSLMYLNLSVDFVSGLVSDAFHLTFGCGLLTFSLFAIAASRTKPDRTYTYG